MLCFLGAEEGEVVPLELHLSSVLFGDTMVPYNLLLGYSILYREYNLTRFNHPKIHYSVWKQGGALGIQCLPVGRGRTPHSQTPL